MKKNPVILRFLTASATTSLIWKLSELPRDRTSSVVSINLGFEPGLKAGILSPLKEASDIPINLNMKELRNEWVRQVCYSMVHQLNDGFKSKIKKDSTTSRENKLGLSYAKLRV